ncbi:CoA pyrophosphatase [candidate division TA06 bacterium]|uniref:CoA pyrophosphatase n=1 Tax=candidate division TA06 bacterium TaxID=2250710 RepID=A0A523XPQ9_UNCT6|nr:MAG: CoA pyrophosphatase [candidate division TA06 bacterium]
MIRAMRKFVKGLFDPEHTISHINKGQRGCSLCLLSMLTVGLFAYIITNVRFDLTFETIRKALSLPLPGRPAQLKMSTQPRPGDRLPFKESKFRDGAVLIITYPIEEKLHLALTKRTQSVASHKGHISFPGGAREPDEALLQTALRECEEEIGVNLPEDSVIGTLSVLHVPVSGYRVKPFVAISEKRPLFHPDPREVKEIIEVPIDLFLNEKNISREWQTHQNRKMLVPFYRHGNNKIWGATAMILSEFAELLLKVVEP